MDTSNTPEKITIIEGPTPTFEPAQETWLPALAEGPRLPHVALTRLRTINGPAMVERCWKAWDEGRPVRLEFRDPDGLTRMAEILAARSLEAPEGHILLLYVRLDESVDGWNGLSG